MVTKRSITPLIMLLIITFTAWFGRWIDMPVAAGQSEPAAPASPAALMPFAYEAAVAEHDWAGVWRLGWPL